MSTSDILEVVNMRSESAIKGRIAALITRIDAAAENRNHFEVFELMNQKETLEWVLEMRD
jgi:hypothetical protein